MIKDVFLWHPTDRTFKPRPVCPHVACGAGLQTLGSPGLGRCPKCGGLYEAVMLPSPFEENITVEWGRRAAARHCTLTGARLTGPSLIDWPEAGGSPGRNFCTPDMMGQVFGHPNDRAAMTMKPREGWPQSQVATPRVGAWDSISSLSIVKGFVVAITRRGSVAVIDPADGKLMGQAEWPAAGMNASDMATAVESPPAAIDTSIVIVSPGAAVFRDLAFELGFESAGGRPRLVTSTHRDAVFASAPMTIAATLSLFCLLEHDLVISGPADARLRFFTSAGAEVARLALGFVPARPPLFDPKSGTILLLDGQGHLYAFRTAQLPAQPPAPGQSPIEFSGTEWPSHDQDKSELPDLNVSSRPTFVHAENDAGETDLWLLQGNQSQAALYRANLRDITSGARWRWDRYLLRGCNGDPNGLAVGRGAPELHGSGNLVAFCSEQGAYVYQKSSRDDHPLDTIVGPEGRGTRGSHEPPLLCGAGVLVRTHNRLFLGQLGTPWSGQFSTEGRLAVGIDGEYRYAQGLVCLGSTCFVGAGLTVQAIDIAVTGAR